MDDCGAGDRLLDLKREMVWDGLPVQNYLHACEDKQVVRDRVFEFLATQEFTVEATLLEKSKAQPQTRTSLARFYQYAWHYHLYGIRKRISEETEELLLTAASIMEKKKQKAFSDAVTDVASQHFKNIKWATHHPKSAADPCLQIADYCTWAIQRKWERDDTRSYDLIKDKVRHEYNSWAHGATHYY